MSEALLQYKEYAIMATGPSVYQHPTLVRRLDNLLCDMAAEPEIAHFIMDKFTNSYVEYFAKMFESAKGQIDILRGADDLGMQDRMLISPALFSEFIAPKLKKIVDMAHSYGVKVMFHSCGCIFDYIDGIIETGVEILDPIQITAKGMEPKRLKEKYGDKLCFHGSIDTQYVLPTGNYEEIRRSVEQVMEAFGRDGGYILAPSHTVQPDIPMENILALHEMFKEIR